jgi:hypothetical protein
MNRDFSDLLSAFGAHHVEYLIIGAHALAAHGHARATKDMDVWVRPSPDNARRVHSALAAFGAPLAAVTVEDFATPGTVLQIGVAPVRIDILTEIDGVDFEEAWLERVPAHFGSTPAFVISKRHLVQNKRATGRLQDLADVERLERGGDDD